MTIYEWIDVVLGITVFFVCIPTLFGLTIFLAKKHIKVIDRLVYGNDFGDADAIILQVLRLSDYSMSTTWPLMNRRLFPEVNFKKLPKKIRTLLKIHHWLLLVDALLVLISFIM